MKNPGVSLLLLLVVLVVASLLFAAKVNDWPPEGDSLLVASCDPVRDSLALLAVYRATDGANWFSDTMPDTSFRWLEDYARNNIPIRRWPGVRVNDEGCVCVLDLDGDLRTGQSISPGGLNMLNSLPDSIGQLKQLDSLFLTDNFFLEGTLPDSFYTLTNLQYAIIDVLAFTEPLRPELSDMTGLRVLIGDFNDWTFRDVLPAAAGLRAILDRGGLYDLSPQDADFSGGTIFRNEGESLLVVLDVDDAPGNRYEWTKDGQPWNTFQDNDSLAFPIIRLDDAGTYQATIYNDAVPNMSIPLAPLVIEVTAVGCTGEGTARVTSTADAGPGSLRSAILCCNANPETDTIRFDLGPGGQVITPSTPLPIIRDTGVTIIGDDNLVIDGSNLDTGDNGIVVQNTRDITISGLKIRNMGDDGIAANEVVGLTIENSTLTSNGRLSNTGEGILVQNCQEVVIRGNRLSNNQADGIDVKWVTNFTIQENNSFGNGSAGINVFNSVAGSIIGDTLTANGQSSPADGIFIQQSEIIELVGNLTVNNEEDGIDLNDCTDFTITDNTSLNNEKAGICFANSSGGVVRMNTLGNQRGTGLSQRHGILVDDFSRTTRIEENYIGTNSNEENLGHAEDAIEVQDNTSDLQIINNRIGFSAERGLQLKSSAINVFISRNRFFCNTEAGISFDEGANSGIQAPVITAATPDGVSGTLTIPVDVIELYRVNEASCPETNSACQGYELLDTLRVADGTTEWSISGLANLEVGDEVVALGHADQASSPFSNCMVIEEEQCIHPDYAALLVFYNNSGGDNWRFRGTGGDPTSTENGWGKDCNVCNWYGIVCDSNERVTQLLLSDNNLSGVLPDTITSLSQLQRLNLGDNPNLTGSLPASIQNLGGTIISIYLRNTAIGGALPSGIYQLPLLRQLDLGNCNFSDTLSSSIENLPSLERLNLRMNSFYDSVPDELGNLSNLLSIKLDSNEFTGALPASLGQLQNLMELYLNHNDLSGPIPATYGNLAGTIRELFLNNNMLSGCFEDELAPLCEVNQLDFSNNPALPNEGNFQFFCDPDQTLRSQTGADCNDGEETTLGETIQEDCSCQVGVCEHPDYLALMAFYRATNGQGWDFNGTNEDPESSEIGWGRDCEPCNWYGIQCDPTTMRVTHLDLDGVSDSIFSGQPAEGNNLVGFIPDSIGQLEELLWLNISYNEGLGGSTIPRDIGNLRNLTRLFLVRNDFYGRIPETLGQLSRLTGITIAANDSLGGLPASLGNLTRLRTLFLDANNIQDTIPHSFRNLQSLSFWTMINNKVRGTIPEALGDLPSLGYLALASNCLSGEIPANLANLPISTLSLHSNKLSGCIPIGFREHCGVEVRFFNNPMLPYEGVFQEWCDSNFVSIGAPCKDIIPETFGEEIMPDCSCQVPTCNDGWQNGDETGVDCGTLECGPCPCDHPDYEALMAFFQATNGLEWNFNGTKGDSTSTVVGWGRDCAPCDWYGLSCNAQGRVISIKLDSNRITGNLPLAIGGLPFLQELNLNNNVALGGQLPFTLGRLSLLRKFTALKTWFSGALPDSLSRLTLLEELSISTDSFPEVGRITSGIPASYGDLRSLQNLTLSGLGIRGEIPATLGDLSGLQTLNLNNNELRGSIPNSFEALDALTTLRLADNELSGAFPTEFGAMASVRSITIRGNQFSGPISPTIGNATQLSFFNASSNRFLTDSIPVAFANCINLSQLFLNSNRLSGRLPTALAQLPLQRFEAQDNLLVGCIPPEYSRFCDDDVEVRLGGNDGLSWRGDFSEFCRSERTLLAQVGADCRYDNGTLIGAINEQCTCACPRSSVQEEFTTAIICDQDSLLFNDIYRKEEGWYRDTLVGREGCDSVVQVLDLVTQAAPSRMITDVFCSGEVYEFYDTLIQDAGDYEQSIANPGGDCDSVVFLRLTEETAELPFAANDEYTFSRTSQELELPVLDNDTYFDQVKIMITVFPEVGTLREVNNRLFYQPDGRSEGIFLFRYRVCLQSCEGLCSEGEVQLNIGKDCLAELKEVVPNIFTPNEDRFNELFAPYDFLSQDCQMEIRFGAMRIFNKSGQQVFYSAEYQKWDGMSNGRRVPSGTYIYQIEILGTGQGKTFGGYIEVLRER